MQSKRSSQIAWRILGSLAVLSLVLASMPLGEGRQALAQEMPTPAAPGTDQPGIRALAEDGSSLYYYADGRRIPLAPSVRWVSVKFASESPIERAASMLGSGAPLDIITKPRQVSNPELTLLPVRPGTAEKTLIQGINSMRAMPAAFLEVNPVFQAGDTEMAITDQFIASFPPGQGLDTINDINLKYGAELVEPLLGQPNTFVLKVAADTGLDSLAMANLYQETGAAIHAAPNFVRFLRDVPLEDTAVKTPDSESAVGPLAPPNDYWYSLSDQWYLNNTQPYGTWMTPDADIDAPEAWVRTTGSSSVVIAVIDEGVDLTHEDLSAKLVTGYDATGGGSGGGPCTPYCGDLDDPHGTAVAGIAAASTNNGIGMAGVCRGCSIMPVRVASGDGLGEWITYDSWLANGITWAYQNGASVLNNSWGGGSETTVINTAISNARTLGRAGKGSVVVFSAGNGNTAVEYPAYLSTVMAVGASNMCDQRKQQVNNNCNGYEGSWGSNYGSPLDISAPGVWLTTTDRMGNAGYCPWLQGCGAYETSPGSFHYYGYFNGTSGAAPIVSGVAGLVLSANPNLSAAAVQAILQETADDLNTAGWDQETGYGRVNADRAVAHAGLFADGPIPGKVWMQPWIDAFYNAGITTGCGVSPLRYCPENQVTRAEMAVFLLRAKHGAGYVPPAPAHDFADVPVTGKEWMEPWIEQFYAEGITGGCGGGNYCPENKVTRAEMAVFVLRALNGGGYVPPAASGVFADVPAPGKAWMEPWIIQFYNAGITGGCGVSPLRYCPENNVTRAEMAVFIDRAYGLYP